MLLCVYEYSKLRIYIPHISNTFQLNIMEYWAHTLSQAPHSSGIECVELLSLASFPTRNGIYDAH